MKKKLIFGVALILILACAVCLAACDMPFNGNETTEAEVGDAADNNTGAISADASADSGTVNDSISSQAQTQTAVTAYEIAVKHGFVGTEEDWLESLKGADAEAAFTIEDLYDAAVEAGFNGDFLAFVREYFSTSDTSDGSISVSKAIRSIVTVVAKYDVTVTTYNWMGIPNGTTTSAATSAGAGVIYKLDKVNGDAFIITNFHIIYNASSTTLDKLSDEVNVYLYGSQYADMAIPATIVGGSAYYDIAVLKVTANDFLKASDARAVDVTTGSATVGEAATVIGFPAGEGISATSGIVSVDSETINVRVDGTNAYSLRVMRVDAAINNGNSGGGVFNSNGELIGIVNAKDNDNTTENIGYCIPGYVAVAVADNIITNCDGETKVALYKCMIGVTPGLTSSKMVYDESTGKTSIVETVKVNSVVEGSLSDGILQVGDILVSISLNDKTKQITRYYDVSDFLLNARVGDTLTITFLRDGTEQTAEMVFDEASLTTYFTK